MKLNIWTSVLLCFVSWLAWVCPGYADMPAARVQSMLEEVMAVQTNPELKGPTFRDQRRAAIKKIIAQNFDFEAMAKGSLGEYWEKLKGAERAEFKGIFQDLFQESYTKLVLDFLKREKILFNQEDLHPGKALVKTTIVRVNEEIPVDYFLNDAPGSWLIEDVAIDGVSIVRNYQRSFNQVIRRESYKSLLQKMRLQQQAIEKPS